MGLLSIIRKQQLKDREIRILMLGLDNSGKTTIVHNLLNEDVNEVNPTMGFEIRTINYDGYNLNIWDVGGQKTIRSFWFNYFEKNDVLIFVIDGLSIERLPENLMEFNKLLKEDQLVNSKLLVIINKMDLVKKSEQDRVVFDITNRIHELIEDTHFKQSNNMKIIKVSAIDDEYKQELHSSLDWIIQVCGDKFTS